MTEDEVRDKIDSFLIAIWKGEFNRPLEDAREGILAIPAIAEGIAAVKKGWNAKVDRDAELPENPYMCYCHTSDLLVSVLTRKALIDRLVEDTCHHAYKETQEAMEGWVKEAPSGKAE